MRRHKNNFMILSVVACYIVEICVKAHPKQQVCYQNDTIGSLFSATLEYL